MDNKVNLLIFYNNVNSAMKILFNRLNFSGTAHVKTSILSKGAKIG